MRPFVSTAMSPASLFEFAVPTEADSANANDKGVPGVWARMKIADLADQSTYNPNAEWAEQIKQVASTTD